MLAETPAPRLQAIPVCEIAASRDQRPYRGQGALYEDVVAEAAARFESLAINHPFIDGNKRVAFAATDIFLRITGCRQNQSPAVVFARVMDMFDAGAFDIAHLEPWLRGIIAQPE